MTCHAVVLQRAQSADMGQLGSGGEPMEVITEVDAWDKACVILESGCTPQQAWTLSCCLLAGSQKLPQVVPVTQ